MKHYIEVACLEFDEHGNTLWVHDEKGNTVLRIKSKERIVVNKKCVNNSPHADMCVSEAIEICIPETKMS